MNFADRLVSKILEKKNPVCAGLDPHIEYMPGFLKDEYKEKFGNTKKAVSEMFFEFNKNIIDAVTDLVPAVKANIAFYEKYGKDGIECFERTVQYAHSKNLIVLEDAKRNDLANTALAYAEGALGEVDLIEGKTMGYDVDAIVVNAYMGSDTITPFLGICEKYGKGIFVMAKTSNKSAGQIQDLECGGKKVYEIMGEKAREWGKDLIGDKGYSSCGMVVGATYPEEAEKLRKINPTAYFLVPGYGLQGSDPCRITSCFDDNGLGAIVNNSRGIDYAYLGNKKFSEKNYADAARQEVISMIKDINTYLNNGK